MKLSSITREELAAASGAGRPEWAGLRFDPIGGAAGGALGGVPGMPAPGHDIGVPYEPSPSPTMPTDMGGYPPPYDLGQWGTPYPGWEDGGSQLGGAAWPAASDPSTLLPQDPGIQLPGDPGFGWPPGFDPSTVPGDPILDPQPGIGDPPEPGIGDPWADPWTNPEAPNTNDPSTSDPSQAGDSVDDQYTGIDDEDGPIGMPDPGTGEPTPSEPIGMPEPPNTDLEGTQDPGSDWGQDETGGGDYGDGGGDYGGDYGADAGGDYGGGEYGGGDYGGGDYGGGDYGGGDYGGGGDY